MDMEACLCVCLNTTDIDNDLCRKGFLFVLDLLLDKELLPEPLQFRFTDFEGLQEGFRHIITEFDWREYRICSKFNHSLRRLQPFILQTLICCHTVSVNAEKYH